MTYTYIYYQHHQFGHSKGLLLNFIVFVVKPIHHDYRQIDFKEHNKVLSYDNLRRSIIFSYSETYDFSWLDKYRSQNIEINAYNIYNISANATRVIGIPMNKGREAMVYLTYIIDNYENLSDGNLFVHGHLESWHQKSKLNGLIEHLKWDHDSYANLRCSLRENKHDSPKLLKKCIKFVPNHIPNVSCQNLTSLSYSCYFDQIWENVMRKHGFGELPSIVITQCCAQFFVSKRTILRNNKKLYIDLRQEIMNENTDSYNIGMSFEFMWHIIFTNSSIFCPPYEECYCQMYNLCNDYEIKRNFYSGAIKLR